MGDALLYESDSVTIYNGSHNWRGLLGTVAGSDKFDHTLCAGAGIVSRRARENSTAALDRPHLCSVNHRCVSCPQPWFGPAGPKLYASYVTPALFSPVRPAADAYGVGVTESAPMSAAKVNLHDRFRQPGLSELHDRDFSSRVRRPEIRPAGDAGERCWGRSSATVVIRK